MRQKLCKTAWRLKPQELHMARSLKHPLKSIKRLALLQALIVAAASISAGNTAHADPYVHTYAETDAPLYYGEYFWDETGAPKARTEIVVDLRAEQLYVYRGGVEIGRAVITRGWQNHKTPLGTFPILEKDADHYSSTYGGAAMPYNLRLTWTGVAIHGAEVDDESATHGCIGIPVAFARTLFRNVRVGDTVFVTNNWKPEFYGYP
jgi:L,D-transpeptidase catalytic domain